MCRLALAHILLVVLITAATPAAVAHAQDPLKAYPNNYSLLFDNAQVRVLRCHYGPHEHVGVHNHSDYPTVYVYISDAGPVRFSHVEEKAFVMTRPPVKAGSFRVSPGRPERHTVENLSDLPSDYLRIELKQIPLHGTLSPKRGEAPATLDRSGATSVFNDPDLTIDRVVCLPGAPCQLASSASPSLLVSLSPAKLSGSLQQEMKPGNVAWLPASNAAALDASGSAPAHLLRLHLLRTKR
jgi:hypothetical protein